MDSQTPNNSSGPSNLQDEINAIGEEAGILKDDKERLKKDEPAIDISSPEPDSSDSEEEEIREQLQKDFTSGATSSEIIHDHENISFVGQSVKQPVEVLQGKMSDIKPVSEPLANTVPVTPANNSVTPPVPPNPAVTTAASNTQQPIKPIKPLGDNSASSKSSVPSIRTYSSDVKGAVNQDKLTTSKIVLAEQKRRLAQQQKAPASIDKSSNVGMIWLVISIIFILGGVGLLAWYFLNRSNVETLVVVPTLSDVQERFITLDSQESVVFNDFNTNDVLARIAGAQTNLIPPQTVKEVAIGVLKIVENEDIINYATTEELFERLRVRADDRLVRALGDDFVYGFYGGFENEPFLLIQVLNHEIAYPLMFGYEDAMVFDLHPLFPNVELGIEAPVEEASSVPEEEDPIEETEESETQEGEEDFREKILEEVEEFEKSAQSKIEGVLSGVLAQATSTFAQGTTPQEDFTDLIVSNQDVRVLYNTDNELLLLYGFLDRSNLIITTDPKAFEEIVNRIRTKALIK